MINFHVWQHVPGKALLFLVNLVAATALIYEGMWRFVGLDLEP